MPIYEYVCAKCERTFEVLQRLSEPPLDVHDGCGGAVSKVASSPRLRVKENDGLTGSTHSSILRFNENTKLEAERKKKSGA
jgi:putative FmdB family regulatory protein